MRDVKALRYFGPKDVRYEPMSDPTLETDDDALVKMEACSICGSDLHIYDGHGFSDDVGFCVGHEAVGEIVDIGRSVRRLRRGDKVMIPAAVGCGACRQCLLGAMMRCEAKASAYYGLSSKLQGLQSDIFRVPVADMHAIKVPEGVTSDQALMLTDAMATAWYGVKNADVLAGHQVAVVGLGPIGLMAVDSAFVRGASIVYAVDPVAERRACAARAGAIPLHPDVAIEAIREQSGGHKLPSVVEAAGNQAALDMALRLVSRGGTVSVIGAHQAKRYAFPLERAFAAGLTFRLGTCSMHDQLTELFALVRAGRLKPERYITHRMPLQHGAEAYRLLAQRENGVLKIALTA
ncbi:MAG: alcohol dehydrogenase catalytic domain-containing protein [Hyphomonadaceae bacterium JAD_PAG50586_4]|nr:MAG: alcohol dehydrogenase catalytic domain-containing protein [Hyphomonadaceae bacterium JAD_PAG50586_4]